VGLLVAALIALQLVLVVRGPLAGWPGPVARPAGYSNTQELGSVLYTVYAYPFEIAAVILLVAIVAAIALTMRRRRGVKHQPPERQVRVRSADRVRLVSLPVEKGAGE
jgi:NADH-quinone oxidoreductase subunit J